MRLSSINVHTGNGRYEWMKPSGKGRLRERYSILASWSPLEQQLPFCVFVVLDGCNG
jgi:hypothetical protein